MCNCDSDGLDGLHSTAQRGRRRRRQRRMLFPAKMAEPTDRQVLHHC